MDLEQTWFFSGPQENWWLDHKPIGVLHPAPSMILEGIGPDQEELREDGGCGAIGRVESGQGIASDTS